MVHNAVLGIACSDIIIVGGVFTRFTLMNSIINASLEMFRCFLPVAHMGSGNMFQSSLPGIVKQPT